MGWALVVDDSRAMRRIIGRMITKLGLEVREAGNGVEALAVLEEHGAPSILLADWHMPEMDGLTLVAEVRGRPEWATLPIVMVTSEVTAERVSAAFEAGANEYIMKPFQPDDLKSLLVAIGVAEG